MAGKPTLISELTARTERHQAAIRRALEDGHITAREARELAEQAADINETAQEVQTSQELAVSILRFGEPSREPAYAAAAMTARRASLMRRAKRTA